MKDSFFGKKQKKQYSKIAGSRRGLEIIIFEKLSNINTHQIARDGLMTRVDLKGRAAVLVFDGEVTI